jgi:hypothetical protein
VVALIGLVGCIICRVFRGLDETSVDPSIFCLLSTIRLFVRRGPHGHFHNGPRKGAPNLLKHAIRELITDANVRAHDGVYANLRDGCGEAARWNWSQRLRLQHTRCPLSMDSIWWPGRVIALLLVALLRRSPLNYEDLSAFQQHRPHLGATGLRAKS